MDRPLLSGISLRVDPSTRLGLVGSSASGKSSLLRVMAMLDPITGGQMLFRGQTVPDTEIPSFRRQVVYLAQHPSMILGTVRANLEAPFCFKSAATEFDLTRVLSLFERLGKPASILDQTTDQLSGGERQLIALVRALQLDPAVLLLDEPTSALDDDAAGKFESLLEHWRQDGASRSFVWVSHDGRQVERMTDQIVRMTEGRLV